MGCWRWWMLWTRPAGPTAQLRTLGPFLLPARQNHPQLGACTQVQVSLAVLCASSCYCVAYAVSSAGTMMLHLTGPAGSAPARHEGQQQPCCHSVQALTGIKVRTHVLSINYMMHAACAECMLCAIHCAKCSWHHAPAQQLPHHARLLPWCPTPATFDSAISTGELHHVLQQVTKPVVSGAVMKEKLQRMQYVPVKDIRCVEA